MKGVRPRRRRSAGFVQPVIGNQPSNLLARGWCGAGPRRCRPARCKGAHAGELPQPVAGVAGERLGRRHGRAASWRSRRSRWIARTVRARRRPRARRRYRSWSSRSRMPHDQSSPMMWCITRTRHGPAAPSSTRMKRCSGPRARSKGSAAMRAACRSSSSVPFRHRGWPTGPARSGSPAAPRRWWPSVRCPQFEGRAKRLVPGDQAVERPAQRARLVSGPRRRSVSRML